MLADFTRGSAASPGSGVEPILTSQVPAEALTSHLLVSYTDGV